VELVDQVSIGILYAILFWLATLVLVLGVTNKIILYARIPAPLKIPTTPAPLTKKGVALRMAQEVLCFKSLFRADKLLWLVGILFHYSLLFIVIRHFRYIMDSMGSFLSIFQAIGKYSGFIFVIALIILLLRRLLIDRVKYISSPSDIAMLLLLIAIGVSGLFMQYVSHTDIVMVKVFFRGLIEFNWQPLPSDFVLLLHLGLVAVLMLVFPISKLLHAPGVFFSPTRNQIDNPREKRHISSWAQKLEEADEHNG